MPDLLGKREIPVPEVDEGQSEDSKWDLYYSQIGLGNKKSAGIEAMGRYGPDVVPSLF